MSQRKRKTMPDDPTTDPVLTRFRTAVKDLYGDRLARVVLYGSRARGDHHPNSDYDIAVFLNDLSNRAIEMRRLADLETGILFDTDSVINALPFPAPAYREQTGFMNEVRRDGLAL
jgi:predicted nucleotidyltransferase